MKTVRIIEFEGRGLSMRDAIDHVQFAPNGELILQTDPESYKNGKLRIKRFGDRAIPVIIYDGETEDEMCFAFQGKVREGRFVDFDINAIGEALTYYTQHCSDTSDPEDTDE